MTTTPTTTTTTTAVRIKAEFGFYSGTFNAPQDGYLSYPKYDRMTGRDITSPLEFSSVADAYAYLTGGGYGCDPADGLACEYDGAGDFSRSGHYVTSHGQHSRPVYTIVSAKSGRCTKAIIAACEEIQSNED